jgi:hypothetical protein
MSDYLETMPAMDRKKTVRVDISNLDTIDGASLGDKVELKITGVVKRMSSPTENMWEDAKGKKRKETYPGDLEITINSMELEVVGEFDEL